MYNQLFKDQKHNEKGIIVMETPRKYWTMIVGADDTEPTRSALNHINRVFAGIPGDDRPELILFRVIEQSLAPGAEFGEPTFAWEAGGVSGITPPLTGDDFHEIEQTAIKEMDSLERILVHGGWSPTRIKRKAAPGGFSKALIADAIAYHAKEEKARVVVVGRTRHGRLHEAILKSIGERLTHYLPGVSVWVVGSCESDGEEKSGDDHGKS